MQHLNEDLKGDLINLTISVYPYDDLNIKFNEDRYSIIYEMYARFQQNYYMRESQPMISWENFKTTPIMVIDVSHQNEMIKTGPIDVRIQFERGGNVANTVFAYCLVLYDRIVEYTPLTGIVRKIH